MGLTSGSMMRKYDEQVRKKQELSEILSLPEEVYLEIMKKCETSSVAEIAKEYGFSIEALSILYIGYQEQQKEKDTPKYKVKEDEIITRVVTSSSKRDHKKYIIGYNKKQEILFQEEFTSENFKKLKRQILVTAKKLLSDQYRSRNKYIKQVGANWKAYFKLEQEFLDVKEELSKQTISTEEKKRILALDIKYWELNQPSMAPKKMRKRLDMMKEALIQRENKIDKPVAPAPKITFETFTYTSTKTNKKETISELSLLKSMSKTIIEQSLISENEICGTNFLNEQVIYTPQKMKQTVYSEANDFLKRLEQYGILKEDLTPRLQNYYDQCIHYLENEDLVLPLNRLGLNEINSKFYENIFKEKNSEIETPYGTLFRSELETLLETFSPTCNYVMNYTQEEKKGNVEYLTSSEILVNLATQSRVLSNFQYKCVQFLRIVSKSDVSTSTPLFKDLINFAKWVIKQPDLKQAFLNGNAPIIQKTKEKQKKINE